MVILNNSNTPRHIRHGDIIGTATPVQIIEEIQNDDKIFKLIGIEKLGTEAVYDVQATQQNLWKPGDCIKLTNKFLTGGQKQKIRDVINEYYMIFSTTGI